MTILVTGGAGYIGSHMVHGLADAGERVVVLDNLSTGFDWALPRQATLVVGDTGDPTVAKLKSTPSSTSPPRSSCPTRSPIRSATTATTPPPRAA